MKNRRNKFIFLILLLGLFLRLFKVGQYPATLYGDEQAFAWNAYNILKTGQDEFGTPYPLQFRSFDDYKAPIPVYLLVPFIRFLGLNAFTVRLPAVIFSVLTVYAIYLLARKYINSKSSLLASFLLAVSPWHVHLSRGYFEATISLFFMVSGVYFFVKSRLKTGWLILSMLFFALSIYSYFTPRILFVIFIPFLLVYGFIYFRENTDITRSDYLKGMVKKYLIAVLFLGIISLPLINATLFDKGFSRFSKLTTSMNSNVIKSVIKERNTSLLHSPWSNLLHNKATVWVRTVKDNYLEHLSLNFWYIYGDSSLRYFLGNMGMFYLAELPFFIIGAYFLLREKRWAFILFTIWILFAPIPASIVGKPFAVRSLSMLPAPFIFVGYGIYKFLSINTRFKIKVIISAFLTIIFISSLGSVLIRYYFEYPVYAATWWGWENKAALDFARQNESSYDQIFMSDYYTGAPLAYGVYNAYDPMQFRKSINNPVTLGDGRKFIKFGKYYIGSFDISDPGRLSKNIIPPKSLYIGRPEEIDFGETINAPDDNRIIFKIYRTK
jgi:4-amino-4-deoxy-L-arabinose transferase-like glycosyltransferase